MFSPSAQNKIYVYTSSPKALLQKPIARRLRLR